MGEQKIQVQSGNTYAYWVDGELTETEVVLAFHDIGSLLSLASEQSSTAGLQTIRMLQTAVDKSAAAVQAQDAEAERIASEHVVIGQYVLCALFRNDCCTAVCPLAYPVSCVRSIDYD